MMKMRFPVLLLVLGVLLASCQQPQQKEAVAAPKPNIVFILADDLGIGDLGSYGQQIIKTPNLDKMAAQGMQFTQFYAGTSVCAPSRSALMTGLHTGHTPIRGNKEIQPEGQWPLPDSAVTLAEMLKAAGYVTGDFGKWGMGFVGTTGDPTNQGFDTFFGYNCQRQSHNFYPDHLWHNQERIDYDNTPANPKHYAAQIIHDRSLQFIDQHQDKPFFLYLSYTLPHAALQVPEDTVFEQYKVQLKEQPQPIPAEWNGKGYQPQAYPKAAYATMVSRLDSYVGEVLAKLKALGLDKNTLVIFSSDNGPHKEGGNDPAYFNSNAGFKGTKRDLYEGGIRVPLLAWWPGQIKAGSRSDHQGAFWDFMPTFAEVAGGRVPAYTDGISIVPALLQRPGQQQHPYLYWEFHEDGGKQAVRMGKWKGIQLKVLQKAAAPLELYNLENDPEEKINIAEQHPDIVRQLTKLIRQAHVENETFPFVSLK